MMPFSPIPSSLPADILDRSDYQAAANFVVSKYFLKTAHHLLERQYLKSRSAHEIKKIYELFFKQSPLAFDKIFIIAFFEHRQDILDYLWEIDRQRFIEHLNNLEHSPLFRYLVASDEKELFHDLLEKVAICGEIKSFNKIFRSCSQVLSHFSSFEASNEDIESNSAHIGSTFQEAVIPALRASTFSHPKSFELYPLSKLNTEDSPFNEAHHISYFEEIGAAFYRPTSGPLFSESSPVSFAFVDELPLVHLPHLRSMPNNLIIVMTKQSLN